MKLCLAIVVGLLFVPLLAHAHTEIFIPKVFSPAELPNTGFVFLNPDPILANVNVYLIGTGGSVVARREGQSSIAITAGGQLAVLGSELFPQAAAPGWVYILNDTEGMQAFWMNYDSGITFLDGSEAAGYETIGADQVIPLIAGQSELNVINPGFARVPVTLRLFGENGELAAAVSRELPVAGAFQSAVSDLFPGVEMVNARYLRIQTSGAQVASSAVIRNYLVGQDSGVLNGINVTARSEFTFPHVVNGAPAGANYSTVIGVANLSSSPQMVTITFTPDGGPAIEVRRTITGNGGLRESAATLFGLPGSFQSGWIGVAGTGPLTGFAAYADTVGGGFAVVPPAVSMPRMFFSHIANGAPQWQTGLALLNAGSATANIEVLAMTPAGSLIGRTEFALLPGTKTARAIHEWIPAVEGVNGGFVYVRTINNVPLFGIELFYTRDLKVLSNVAAGRLVSGVVYNPPAM